MGLGSFLKQAANLADPATTALQTLVGGGSLKTAAGQLLDPGGFTGNNPTGMFAPSTAGATEEKQLAGYLQKEAAPLIKAGETGKLTPQQQAAIDSFRKGATAQSKAELAKLGMGTSTTAVEAANQIDATAQQVTNQFLQTDLQEGLAYLGAAEGNTMQVVAAQTQANAAMGEAFGSMAGAVGAILGSHGRSGSSGPEGGYTGTLYGPSGNVIGTPAEGTPFSGASGGTEYA